jgi:putative permease
MNPFKAWLHRHLSDPQVVILGAVLLAGLVLILFFGRILAPVLASLVLAYLLEGLVERAEHVRLPRLAAVVLVFMVFLVALFFLLFGLLPILSRQVGQLVQDLPTMVARAHQELLGLPERFPEVVTEEQVDQLMGALGEELGSLGQAILSISLEGVRSLITVLIYIVLMPLLVFFFLKDKAKIKNWFFQFLPNDRALTTRVWRDVDLQIGNYIRGKVWEILLVWVASYVTFAWLDLDFAMLISLLVGFSVLVPYIGATVITLPIAIIGYFDFGFSAQLAWLLLAYGVIQLLDGNLLAPLLLSEVVNLHPVAVIVAVLFFGGIWGFWGVFFAIPLATLVQSVIKAWPRPEVAALAAPEKEPAGSG